ncbi:MAG: GNAT family N-acetyltransferase [Xanthomonadales bacterium]|nr:N-acetyltransferase [Xanthomonadales bacterium]NIX11628.1 GNAT family N-acetyltransferase [Xanthomonadales bacterium]
MRKLRYLESIGDIAAGHWNGLFGGGNPFVRHEFLDALESSGSVGGATGWQPQHLVLEEGNEQVAAMPLYLKTHSYGEFVFDWGWAEAYARHGLEYYPKLLTAVPFTPSAGPRIGFAAEQGRRKLVESIVAVVQELAREHELSGWHLLFPDHSLQSELGAIAAESGLLQRSDVQFHWHNRAYASFDEFLATFRSSRRKTLKRERRLVAEQGVVLERSTGSSITDEEWHGFYKCYRSTYQKRSGHGGYLTRDFFRRLLESMRDSLLLVVARRGGDIVASSLFLFDEQTLYGRYWGALEDVHCLHFEACFYQGIEFCIERGLARFDPGTQGEHKLMRGFEPVTTTSWHWLADERFRNALQAYLAREGSGTEAYRDLAAEFLPYRRDG